MKILITGAGGAAAISVWKSLAKEHELYMADIDPCAAGLYLVPADKRMIIPRGDAPDFIAYLLNCCQQNKIEVLIPTVDVELFPVSENKGQFESKGIKIPLSSAKSLELCRDKYKLLHLCQDTKLTPSFFLLDENTDINSLSYPCFAKPRCGAGAKGAVTIYNKNELLALARDNSYLVQELLPGDEYSVDVYIHSSGKPLASVPRLRMKIDSGIAVACRTVNKPNLANIALKIAEKVGITYVANIQFKANKNGDFKLLEINPRFPGTLPLTVEAGVDIPKILIEDIQGKPCPKELIPFKELMVVRYWTEQFLEIDEWQALCQN